MSLCHLHVSLHIFMSPPAISLKRDQSVIEVKKYEIIKKLIKTLVKKSFEVTFKTFWHFLIQISQNFSEGLPPS